MASGLDVLTAVKRATVDLARGSEFCIHPRDADDLGKIRPRDLIDQGLATDRAEHISAALLKGDLEPLGHALGVRLKLSWDAAQLV